MSVVDAMLGNAVVAAGLVVVAAGVGRLVRSPAVRHAAWVLVLLKLVTPPLFTVPLPVLPAEWAESSARPLAGGDIVVSATVNERTPAAPAWWQAYQPTSLSDWLLAGWFVGTVGWFGWQGRRIVRFSRRVRSAEPAPADVVAASKQLAADLGIANPPAVKLAAGIGSPMLWGWGRAAVVLFPRDLLPRLAPEARDTLLAHELAHYRRRDHWVRVLEVVASGLFWWHPAVWLARRGIEAAEEECCDAWVVGGLAASPRRYAEALLATVDFEAELRRPCLPPAASAASHSATLLRRRLFGIIHAERPRDLPGGVTLRVLVVAGLLVQPVLRAAVPDVPVVPDVPPVSTPTAKPTPQRPKPPAEPRSWATAADPAGALTVLARDHEVLLRQPDGTSRPLGPGRPLAVAFAPGGKALAGVGPGPRVRLWDAAGRLLADTAVAADGRSMAFAPDGSAVYVLDSAGQVTVRDPNTLAPLGGWAIDGPANSLAVSPDGRLVAVACGNWLAESGWVEVWSPADRRRVGRYGADAPLGACRFSPDGSILILGGWDGRTFWRTAAGGSLLAERQLPKLAVSAAAFSPDADTLPIDPPAEPAPAPLPLAPAMMSER